jgi:hypothetical protein
MRRRDLTRAAVFNYFFHPNLPNKKFCGKPTAFFNDFTTLNFYTNPLPGSAHKILISQSNTFCPKGTPFYGSGASDAIGTLECNKYKIYP